MGIAKMRKTMTTRAGAAGRIGANVPPVAVAVRKFEGERAMEDIAKDLQNTFESAINSRANGTNGAVGRNGLHVT